MKFKRGTDPQSEINLTPLIDVVFLLLLFFMITTTFTKETHMTINLPEAQGESGEVDDKSLEIVINVAGEYTVNAQALINTQLATLKTALERESAGDNRLPLIITADANTPHQAVVRAMDAAGQLGFVHLSITTLDPTKR